jgi:hypothetical protein
MPSAITSGQQKNNWHIVGQFPKNLDLDKRLAWRKFAYRAERAASIWLGIENWKRDRDGFGKADVGGFAVRCGTERGYGLVCYFARDKDFPYLLVERWDDLTYRIIGILPFVVAKQMKARGIGMEMPGNTDSWLIPQSNLKLFK